MVDTYLAYIHFNMFDMKKRTFLVGNFLHMAVVTRVFMAEAVPLEYFFAILLLTFIAQYYK